MSYRKQVRKKRRSPLSALIIVLCALAAMCVIVLAISRIEFTKVARYPVTYTEEIKAAAWENSIPAPYIAAVIMAESSYDPQAVSPVGARGLMQLMPDTAEWIAGKFGEEYDPDALFDPDISIRYGAWYLGFLMERYSGDMRCATAAYHAGQGAVDGWLKDPAYSSNGVTLDNIGYESTNTYVSRVMQYYDYYTEAYEKITDE